MMKGPFLLGTIPGVMLHSSPPIIVHSNKKPMAVHNNWHLLTAFVGSRSENY